MRTCCKKIKTINKYMVIADGPADGPRSGPRLASKSSKYSL